MDAENVTESGERKQNHLKFSLRMTAISMLQGPSTPGHILVYHRIMILNVVLCPDIPHTKRILKRSVYPHLLEKLLSFRKTGQVDLHN